MGNKTAKVFLLIFLITFSGDIDNVFRSISTKTGLKPFIIIELTSETQVNDGTIISFLFFYLTLLKLLKKYNLLKNLN